MGDDDNNNDRKENEAVGMISVTRRTAWWGLTVFSVISLAALFSDLNQRQDTTGYTLTRADKWSGTVTIITTALAFIACLAHHFLAKYFVDKWPEGVFSVIVLALWAAGLAAMMDPDNRQAVDERGGIENANLYFSAWASLATAVWVFCSYVTIQAYFKRGDDSTAPPNMTKWYLLVAASFVVMVSSIRIYNSDTNSCNEGDDSSYCKRVKYGLSLGAAAVVFGLVDIVLSNWRKLSVYPEAGLTFVLFALYVVGIAFITFGGEDGPGSTIGNLYFSTWIGFVFSMLLSSKSWNAVRAKMKGGDQEGEEAPAAEGSDKAEGEASEGGDKKAEDAPPEAPVQVSGDDNA